MKKIIALLLVVGALFAFVACKEELDPLAPFRSVLADSLPVSATIDSKLEVDGAVLIKGNYTVTYVNGVAAVAYTNELLGSFPAEGDLPLEKTEVAGSATVDANGTVTAGTIGAIYAAIVAHKIEISESKFSSYSVSGGVLVATISAENGLDLTAGRAITDITFNITTADSKLVGMSFSYGTTSGVMSIVCNYGY